MKKPINSLKQVSSQNLSLDVGSGPHPKGDVNVERFYPSSPHHVGKTAKPTVLADAHWLPFKDGAFSKVTFYHSLEHLQCPYHALLEAIRVQAREGTLVVELPDATKIDGGENKMHLYSWTRFSLQNLLRETGFQVVRHTFARENQKVTCKKMAYTERRER